MGERIVEENQRARIEVNDSARGRVDRLVADEVDKFAHAQSQAGANRDDHIDIGLREIPLVFGVADAVVPVEEAVGVNDAGVSAVHHLSLEAEVEFVLAIIHRALDGEIELVEDWVVVLEIENAEGIELVGRTLKVPGPTGFDLAVDLDPRV